MNHQATTLLDHLLRKCRSLHDRARATWRSGLQGHRAHLDGNPDYLRSLVTAFVDLLRAKTTVDVVIALLTLVTAVLSCLRRRERRERAWGSPWREEWDFA